MNAVTWYMIFIGFLGSDVQPSYALILDGAPKLTQTSCSKSAAPMHDDWVEDRRVNFPDLNGYWICAADKIGLRRNETNTGWHIIWMGYEGDNTWATVALIAPARHMTERQCYASIDSNPAPKNRKLEWEALCAEPLTGQM